MADAGGDRGGFGRGRGRGNQLTPYYFVLQLLNINHLTCRLQSNFQAVTAEGAIVEEDAEAVDAARRTTRTSGSLLPS